MIFKMDAAGTPQSFFWAYPFSVYMRSNVLDLRGRTDATCALMRQKASEAEV